MRAVTRRLLVLIVLVASVGACGGSASPSTQTSPSPATSVAPSVAPSPSAPAVTTDAVIAKLSTSDVSLVTDVTGKLAVNNITIPITGHTEAKAGDTSSLVIVKAPGGDQRSESIRVGGTTYKRNHEQGPWFVEPATTSGRDLSSALTGLKTLEAKGQTTLGGRTVYRFATASGALDAATLGVTTPGISGFAGTMEVLADDSANVVAFNINAAWKQAGAGGTTFDASMELAFTVTTASPSIQKPAAADIWEKFTSKKHGLILGHPGDMTVIASTNTDPDTLAYSEDEYIVAGREPVPSGTTLAQYLKASSDSLVKELKVKVDGQADAKLGSLPGKVIEYHYAQAGKDRYGISAVAISGRNGYYVAIAGLAGSENDIAGFFEQVLTTFAIAT